MLALMNQTELAYAQARFALEGDVQRYVREQCGCPWLTVKVNPIKVLREQADPGAIEVWYEQPGREPYLVTEKPLMGHTQLDSLVAHIRSIDAQGGESLAEMVARLDRQNESHLKAERDAYLDRVMPVAEKIYFEAHKASTGLKGFTY